MPKLKIFRGLPNHLEREINDFLQEDPIVERMDVTVISPEDKEKRRAAVVMYSFLYDDPPKRIDFKSNRDWIYLQQLAEEERAKTDPHIVIPDPNKRQDMDWGAPMGGRPKE